MLYLLTATRREARELIGLFRFGQEMPLSPVPLFYSRQAQIRLAITGSGASAAAAAVTALCTEYAIHDSDFLVNIGTCTASEDLCSTQQTEGGFFLCNKIIELPSQNAFYPDILYRHPFREAQIQTLAGTQKQAPCSEPCLYDREASAIYHAGNRFFAPHRMIFLKKAMADELFTTAAEQKILTDFLNRLPEIGRMEMQENDAIRKYDEEFLARLCRDLHGTHAMSEILRQHIHYCALSGIDFRAVTETMYRDGKLPCKDKREGKYYFEELKRKLL